MWSVNLNTGVITLKNLSWHASHSLYHPHISWIIFLSRIITRSILVSLCSNIAITVVLDFIIRLYILILKIETEGMSRLKHEKSRVSFRLTYMSVATFTIAQQALAVRLFRRAYGNRHVHKMFPAYFYKLYMIVYKNSLYENSLILFTKYLLFIIEIIYIWSVLISA